MTEHDLQAFTTVMAVFTWSVCVLSMSLHVFGTFVGWWTFDYLPTYTAATIACLVNVVATSIAYRLHN